MKKMSSKKISLKNFFPPKKFIYKKILIENLKKNLLKIFSFIYIVNLYFQGIFFL